MLKRGEKLQKLLILFAVWGLLLATMVVYERYFVSTQQAFLKEREYHTLERLAEELNGQIQRAQLSTQSFVQLAAEEQHQSEEVLANFLRLYLPGDWSSTDDALSQREAISVAMKCSVTKGEPVPLQADMKGLALTLYCPNKEDSKKREQIYILNLTSWVEDSFRPLGGDLDEVFVADETGKVLFQRSSPGPRITNLNPLTLTSAVSDTSSISDGSNSSQETSQSSGEKRGGVVAHPPAEKKPSQADNASPRKPTGTSFFPDTTLAGQEYELFVLPVRVPLKSIGDKKSITLVVSGLRLKEGFENDSRSIPYSTLIWATLITVAVFSLSWPLAKLRYMSKTERFTSKDAWFLVLTIFLAAASGTLMLLNANYTSLAGQRTDATLRRLAVQIKDNFEDEMRLAIEQMKDLDGKHDPKLEHDYKTAAGIIIPEYLSAANPSTYPFFDIAGWLDTDGQQVEKFDLRRAPTPLVNVSQLPFFPKVIAEANWDAKSDGGLLHRYYLDPEISLTTAQFAPVLAVPYSHPSSPHSPAVLFLAVRPMSLVEPVFPPGYGFAVIDADCNVLFHSEAFRNKKENFCQESKGTAELRPWLFGGTDNLIDVSYAGRPERAFFSVFSKTDMSGSAPKLQFAGGQAYLVVFRVPDYEVTLNLAVILVCTLLLGFYFMLLLGVVVLASWLPKATHPIDAQQLLWPCAQNGAKYLQIAAANLALLLAFWFLSPYVYEFPLLILTVLTSSLSVLFPACRLSQREGGLLHPGAIIGALSAVAFVVSSRLKSLEDWRYVFVWTAIAGATAIVLSGSLRIGRRMSPRATGISVRLASYGRRKFVAAYTLVALTVIAGICVIPCIGCFKFAYDAVSEVALKHDEIAVSNALLARRDRIRRYYDQLRPMQSSASSDVPRYKSEEERIGSIAERRTNESFDRYDVVSGFTYSCEQKLGLGRVNESVPCESTAHSYHPDPNVWFETIIAKAVLMFPSNLLGSEMSKLGVAATEGPAAGGEHYYDEMDPTRFRLVWQKWSKLPCFAVESAYRPWEGFQWWGDLLIVVLGLLLGRWLARVVRRIFLTDIRKLSRSHMAAWKQASDIQSNCVVLGLAQSGKSQWLRSLPGISPKDYFNLGIELKRMVNGGPCPEPSGEGPVVVVDSFEFNLKNASYNVARLNFLEYLSFESNCCIVLVSSVDPLYFLEESGPEVLADPPNQAVSAELLERWARVLSKFERVRLEVHPDRTFFYKIKDFVRRNPEHRDFAIAVKGECRWTPMLRIIGIDLLDEFDPSDPATCPSVKTTVLDLAREYYQVLWSGLTPNERLALYQLANDGWANPKNRRALQQLESKLLIRRSPMYKIVNASFRSFVASTERAKEIEQWEARQQQSTWQALRLVLVGVSVIGAAWLLHSQAALSQQLAALIAGVAALLTASSALFSRSAKPAPPKPESS